MTVEQLKIETADLNTEDPIIPPGIEGDSVEYSVVNTTEVPSELPTRKPAAINNKPPVLAEESLSDSSADLE